MIELVLPRSVAHPYMPGILTPGVRVEAWGGTPQRASMATQSDYRRVRISLGGLTSAEMTALRDFIADILEGGRKPCKWRNDATGENFIGLRYIRGLEAATSRAGGKWWVELEFILDEGGLVAH